MSDNNPPADHAFVDDERPERPIEENRYYELDGESPVDASSPDPRIAATVPLAPGGRLDRFGNLIKKRGAQQQ